MPLVAAPVILFAVGAMICYLLAQMIVRGQFASAADSIPIIGRYLARGVVAIEASFIRLFKAYVWGSTVSFVHWVVGLATNLADFPREVRAFANAVADALDHLVTVTVHDIVKAFVNPVRTAANAAQAAADDVAADLSTLAHGLPNRIASAVSAGIAGIWSTVHSIVNAAVGDAERIGAAYADDVAGQALDAAAAVAADLDHLAQGLGDLIDARTAAEVAAGVVGLAAVVALVETQVMPLVRDLTECSPKLKATCQTDMSEWLGLLEGLVAIGAMPSLLTLAREAQGAVGDFVGDAARIAGIGGAANVPSHPSGWS